MVAALLDPLQIVVPGFFTGRFPVHAVLRRQVRGYIQNSRVHEPGINVLRGILIHSHQAIALRAVVASLLAVEGGNCAGITAVVTVRPAILGIDTLLEDHFLGNGLVMLLLGQITLGQHFGEDIQLTVAVPSGAVPHFALVLEDIFRVRVEQRGVIGNADQAGTLSGGQALQFLAEIGGGSALDAVAALAQINTVQVLIHDDVLIVLLFEHLGPEYLHDLPLHRNAVLLTDVLNQLLGDGGAAELAVAAEEHIHARLDRCDPVHALMLIKPLVLNGHGGIDQILRDLVQRGDLPVRGGINLLQLLNISAAVHIIKKRGLFQVVVVNGPVRGFRQNIILQIVSQSAHEHHAADQQDQDHRQSGAQRDLQQRQRRAPQSIDRFQRPVGIPVLADLLISPFLFVCHAYNLQCRGTSADRAFLGNRVETRLSVISSVDYTIFSQKTKAPIS